VLLAAFGDTTTLAGRLVVVAPVPSVTATLTVYAPGSAPGRVREDPVFPASKEPFRYHA
jgi:hypothetical protein